MAQTDPKTLWRLSVSTALLFWERRIIKTEAGILPSFENATALSTLPGRIRISAFPSWHTTT